MQHAAKVIRATGVPEAYGILPPSAAASRNVLLGLFSVPVLAGAKNLARKTSLSKIRSSSGTFLCQTCCHYPL